jgi:amino acid transporter
VAANTSFAGFPRLASILAQDGYLPRQLSFLGDRLVFSNGMLLLAGLTGVLIAGFGGDTHALIPLFAVGVFIAFTLSQAGMVIHWLRVRGPGWALKASVNGIGAGRDYCDACGGDFSKFPRRRVDGAAPHPRDRTGCSAPSTRTIAK